MPCVPGSRWLFLLLIAAVTAGCRARTPGGSSDSPSVVEAGWFRETTHGNGTGLPALFGSPATLSFSGNHGGQCRIVDMDNDGDLDVYFVQSGSLYQSATAAGANQLFRNKGDATFANVTDDSGAGDCGYGMGVAAADYDNDGDVDLYVTDVGPNVLLQNDGSGRFADARQHLALGMRVGAPRPHFSMQIGMVT